MTPHLMTAFQRLNLQASRGEGAYLYDVEGRRYLDFMSGVAVNALGHCHPALVEALCRQAGKLWHASNLVRIPEQERLADRLCAVSFAESIFFTNSGSEAVDFSMKLVRRYFKGTEHPGRWRVLSFQDAFHGRSMAAIAAGGQPKLTQGYEPVVEGFDRVPFADIIALREAIGPETAAVFLEPIQGEGGIRSFPAEILREIRSICNDRGLLLVLDEVQTGFGRTGKMFAHEWAGIVPDIVATAKGLGAGYPMGAVLASAEVGKAITPGSHGTTLGGAPLASAVGNALLDVLLGEGFLDDDSGRAGHVTRVGDLLKAALEEVVRCYPETLEEVRGTGLLLGLKCRVENRQFMAGLQELGLLTAPAGQNVVRILPPLNIEESHINEAIGIIRKACEATRP